MTSRRSERRKQTRSGTGGRYTTRTCPSVQTKVRKAAVDRPRGQRTLTQLVICCSTFIILVAVKLLLPARMETINEKLSEALHQNMDVQAVFSTVGQAFAGETGGKDVLQAVLGSAGGSITDNTDKAADDEELLASEISYEPRAAMELLHTCLDGVGNVAEEPETVSTMSYIQYSDQNLPDGVSMEQAILGFDYCSPLCGTVTSGFGYREHPTAGGQRFHYGVDLAANEGTAISCFADGTVTAVGESSSYGKYCIVSHEDGFETLYAHCSRMTTSSGAEVHRGEKLGEVGQTGIATGPHLHFELHRKGVYLNPIYYVAAQQ